MPVAEFTPTVAEVGKFLRARTVDDDGNEQGTFNTSTSPTEDEATSEIATAVTEVAGILGETMPNARLTAAAKTAAILLSAMNIEATYFPEQVANDHSPYEVYERRYNAMMGTPSKPGWLRVAVKDEESGGPEGPDDDLEPLFHFDEFAEEAGWVYDPVTETWALRAPPPSADEGRILGYWPV